MSLRRNAAWNLAGTGLPLLLGVAAIPYLVKHIGVEAFGILTLIWTLIGYFSLFDFGLGRALTQQVAVSLEAGRQRNIRNLVKSGLLFTLLTGLVGGLVLAAISVPLGHGWLKVSAHLQAETTYSLLIAAVGIPLTTTTTGLRGILEAYEDFKVVNIFRISLGTANFLLPVVSVMLFGPALTYIVVLLITARLAIFMAYWIRVDSKLVGSWHKAKARTGHIKRLVSFGAWMTVSNIISPLMVSADRFLIAAVLGASAVAYYTVPFEIMVRILVIPGALTGALFPRLATLLRRDPEVARMLYRRSLKSVSLVMAAICSVAGLGSYWGLTIWLGSDFATSSWAIASVLAFGILLNGIAFVPFAAIQAAGDARTTAYLHIGQLFIYLPLLLLCLYFFGAIGAAFAWVIRAALDLVLLLTYAKRTAGIAI